MVSGWIFGKAADSWLKKLKVLGLTELESEFAEATKRCGEDISGEVSVNTQGFFDPNRDPSDGEDCPKRLHLREILDKYNLPSKEDWYAGLMENWDIVRGRFAEGERHPFYEQGRDKAREYLQQLADALHLACAKYPKIFMVHTVETMAEMAKDIKDIKGYVLKSDNGGLVVEPKLVHNLPYESLGSIFKGRAQALGRLGEVLASGKRAAITRVGTICGLGGIGKTRLAVEFAWEGLREETFCQAYFVRCGMDDKAQGLFGGLSILQFLFAKHTIVFYLLFYSSKRYRIS